MKKFSSITLLIAVLASSIFTSCVKENYPTVNPGESEADKYYVLSHDTFEFDDDVQVLDADTVNISVSKDYLEKLGYDFKASEANPVAVTIWESINTAPYVRNITATAEEGDRVILTTKTGDIGDVFGNADFTLDTQIFIDRSQPQAVTRGGRLVNNYDRYTDTRGTIHPAVIIVDRVGDENYEDALPAGARFPTRGGNAYFTPEDIEQSNGSVDFGIIDTRFNLGEFSVESPEDEDFSIRFAIDSASLAFKSNLRINFTTRWFKLKQFECVLYGKNSFDIATTVEGSATAGWDDEVELARLNCFTTVFMVGPVPVSVSCDVGLQAVYEASASASASFSASYSITDTYELGASYYDGKWYSIAESNRQKGFTGFRFSPVEVDLNAMLGLELFASLKFYGCVGPKVTFGPHISANVAAEWNATEETLDLSSTGELTLGGEYGVELKIWKWKLAGFKHDYDLIDPIELWNFEESVSDEIFEIL